VGEIRRAIVDDSTHVAILAEAFQTEPAAGFDGPEREGLLTFQAPRTPLSFGRDEVGGGVDHHPSPRIPGADYIESDE